MVRNGTEKISVGRFRKVYILRMGPAKEYQIHLYKDDGPLSVIMLVAAYDRDDAKAEAYRMLNGELIEAYVWCGDTLLDILSRPNAIDVAGGVKGTQCA